MAAAAAAKSLQSCPALCNLIDGSPPGSPVPGILQARILEWVAISFSNAWKWKVKVKMLSHVQLLATPWTAAYQAPLSMGFSRQEYWSELLNLRANARNSRDLVSIPGSGVSLVGGHGNPFLYSFFGESHGQRACWATVHIITQSGTWLKWLIMHTPLFLAF